MQGEQKYKPLFSPNGEDESSLERQQLASVEKRLLAELSSAGQGENAAIEEGDFDTPEFDSPRFEDLDFEHPEPDEAQAAEQAPALIDIDEVVEVARLADAPEAQSRPHSNEPSLDNPIGGPEPAALPLKAAPKKSAEEGHKKGFSALHGAIQAVIILFVLSWVFILGILIGRGHLWESGLGHDLVVWLEEKAGWQTEIRPEIILRENEITRFPYDPESQRQVKPNSFDDLVVAEEFIAPDGRVSSAEIKAPELPNPVNGSAAAAPAKTPSAEISSAEAAQPTPIIQASEPEPSSQWLEKLPEPPEPEPAPAPEPVPTATAPAPQPEPAPAPREAPPLADDEGRYAVQVALAQDEQEAAKRVERLRQQGFTSYFYRNSRGYYPVRVGRFKTQGQAQEAKDRLEALGYAEPFISLLGS